MSLGVFMVGFLCLFSRDLLARLSGCVYKYMKRCS